MNYIQKIPQSTVFKLTDTIQIENDQVCSSALVQRKDLTLSLFAIDTHQEIKTHASNGDALVNILSGVAEVTIDGEVFILKAGDSILMPANIPHGLKAVEAFQMLLIVVKPQESCENHE